MTPQEAIILVEECGLNIEGIVSAECEKVVLNALEKQIPKKPLKKSIEYDGEYGYCPCCNHVVAGYDSNNVCRQCGQALNWGDGE